VQSSRLKIALDMMGGDHGPLSTIPAAIEAVVENPSLDLILVGDTAIIEQGLLDAGIQDIPN